MTTSSTWTAGRLARDKYTNVFRCGLLATSMTAYALIAPACTDGNAAASRAGSTFTADRDAVLTSTPRHGTWVYGASAWLQSEVGRDEFMDLVRRFHINDVYLSIFPSSGSLLTEPALPAFLSRLYGNGVRVEAVMGDPSWDSDAGRPHMLARIDDMVAYNKTTAADVTQRFRGAHLDIEPWIGTGDDLSWVEPLTKSYQAAADRLAQSGLNPGMTLVADVAGSKIRKAQVVQRQTMLDSVTRLVLMQYEVSFPVAEQHTRDFLDSLSVNDATHGIIIAIRAKDFPSDVAQRADQLDSDYAGELGYRGWGIYDYDHARSQ